MKLMKKKVMLMVTMLILLLSSLPVYADVQYEGRVIDEADLLSEDVEEDLKDKINDIVDDYEMDVVLLLVDDYEEFEMSAGEQQSGTRNYYDPKSFVTEYYQSMGYGFDDENSGMILLISMAERDWHIYIQGEARVAVNNYGFEYISERLVDKLSDDQYEAAIVRYVEDVELFYEAYDNDAPYGDDNKVKTPGKILSYMAVAVGASAILALIIVLVMKSQMNTAKRQPAAREYVKKGGFVLTNQQDLYLYSNTTKTAIPKSSGSSGGGGRSSGSRGGSGGGGKF